MSIFENLNLAGPTYTFGDTVGLGVLPRRRCAFFTKNGRFLGVTCRDLKGRLYPTVGFSTEARVKANFGAEPFVYKVTDKDLNLNGTMVDDTSVGDIKEIDTTIGKWG
ncbi:hypothetical protein K440DRAFT_104374 [Wilcoxina mikolae CBS 423.85]|nr:hypothetical protein K440DRAFT_104374 [Wilcoxina mikolae CBS 423.85]